MAADDQGGLAVAYRRDVTGFAGGDALGPPDDVLLVRLDGQGAVLWRRAATARTGRGRIRATSVHIDRTGAVVLAGAFGGSVDLGGDPLVNPLASDMAFVAKFDAAGRPLWSRVFPGRAACENPAVSVNVQGGIILACPFDFTLVPPAGVDEYGLSSTDAPRTDVRFLVVALDGTGRERWQARVGAAAGGIDVTGVVAAAAGDAIVIGTFSGAFDFGGGMLTSTGAADAFVARWDARGRPDWSRTFTAEESIVPRAVALDGSGNVLVTGLVAGAVDLGGGRVDAGEPGDLFLLKLDARGRHQWSRVLPRRASTRCAEQGPSLAADARGDAVLVGGFQGTSAVGGEMLISAGLEDAFVTRFDAAGNCRWSRRFGGEGEERATAATVDAAGRVTVAGSFSHGFRLDGDTLGSAGSTSVFVARLAPGPG
jgi:hypothetical protein